MTWEKNALWSRPRRILSVLPLDIREAFFDSRQLKVAEMDGRAQKKRETSRKRSAGAVDDKKCAKSHVQKNVIFAPLETNGRVDGNQKKKGLS